MDSLHYALLAVVVLLVVYCGASFFREASTPKDSHDGTGGKLGQKITAAVSGSTPLLLRAAYT